MYSGVISIFSERITKGFPITIYGDGQQTRDFVNVADVVQANLLAMQVDCQRSEVGGQKSDQSLVTCHLPPATFSIFNVATGKSTSLLSLLENLEAIVGQTVERNFLPVRDGDIQHSLADISKARNILGYTPGVELKEGLSQIVGR